MKTKLHILNYFTILLLVFFSCTEEEITPEYSEIELNTGFKIQSIMFLSDSVGYLTGGERDQFGVIYKTTDAGENWTNIYESDKRINKIVFFDEKNAWACGDSMLLIKTSDGGINWTEPHDFSYVNSQERCNFTSIELFSASSGVVVGDKKLEHGFIFSFNNGLKSQKDIQTVAVNNGLFSVSSGSVDDSYSLCFGFGAIVKYDRNNNTYEYLNIEGDFFSSGCYINNSAIITCGYDGGIYKSDNNGKSWKSCIEKNSLIGERKHFITTSHFYDEYIYVTGEDGMAYKSTNLGDSWIKMNLNTSSALTASYSTEIYTFIGTENGKIYKIKN